MHITHIFNCQTFGPRASLEVAMHLPTPIAKTRPVKYQHNADLIASIPQVSRLWLIPCDKEFLVTK